MPETGPKPPYGLYQRAGSAKWWVRFSMNGEGQIRKPLGTTDRGHAEQLALEAWAEARHRNKQGLRSQAKTFRAVGTEFIALLQSEAERGERRQFQVDQNRRKVERYFIGFFGDKPMDAMREADVVRFWEWSRGYWIEGPGKDIKLLTYMRADRQIRKPITPSARKTPSRARYARKVSSFACCCYKRLSGVISRKRTSRTSKFVRPRIPPAELQRRRVRPPSDAW